MKPRCQTSLCIPEESQIRKIPRMELQSTIKARTVLLRGQATYHDVFRKVTVYNFGYFGIYFIARITG